MSEKLSEYGSTPDISVLDEEAEAFDFGDGEDMGRGKEFMDSREEVVQQLEAMYGGRIFRYGPYSGTVSELKACPAFMDAVDGGFSAACAWLEANDGKGVGEIKTDKQKPEEAKDDNSDKADTAKQESTESVVTKDDVKQPDVIDSKTDVNDTPVAVEALAATDAARDSEDLGPSTNSDTVNGQASKDTVAEKKLDIVETKATVAELATAKAKAQDVDGSTEVDGQSDSEVLKGIMQEPTSASIELGGDSDSLPLVAVGEEAEGTAIRPSAESPSMERFIEASEQERSEIAEVSADMEADDVTLPAPNVETVDRAGIVDVEEQSDSIFDGVDSDDSARELDIVTSEDEGNVNELGTHPNLDTELADNRFEDNPEAVLGIDAAMNSIPRLDADGYEIGETSFELSQDSLDETLLIETALERELDEVDTDTAFNTYVSETDDDATIEEVDPAIQEVIVQIAEFIDEVPENELQAEIPVLRQQTNKVYAAIEKLETSVTAAECKESLQRLQQELERLLVMLGYNNAGQVAERLINRHDIASLKAYMAMLTRSLQSIHDTTVKQAYSVRDREVSRYGMNAVKQVVHLVFSSQDPNAMQRVA